MKKKFLKYYFSFFFYLFLIFTIISAVFYIISLNSNDLIFRHEAGCWLIINLILTLITGGYKFYRDY